MDNVDALSNGILVLESSTLERTLSVCQDRDEEIEKIRKKLEEDDVKSMTMNCETILCIGRYRKDRYKKLLFYVSRLMESNVIRTSHNNLDQSIRKVLRGFIGFLICTRRCGNIFSIV